VHLNSLDQATIVISVSSANIADGLHGRALFRVVASCVCGAAEILVRPSLSAVTMTLLTLRH
jgi:hypothetical protein